MLEQAPREHPLETSTGHLDSGRDPDEHNDAIFRTWSTAPTVDAKKRKEDTMNGHDVTSDLRSRLRVRWLLWSDCTVVSAQLHGGRTSDPVPRGGRAARRAPTMAGDWAGRAAFVAGAPALRRPAPWLLARVGDGSDALRRATRVEQRRGGGDHAGMADDARAGGASADGFVRSNVSGPAPTAFRPAQRASVPTLAYAPSAVSRPDRDASGFKQPAAEAEDAVHKTCDQT